MLNIVTRENNYPAAVLIRGASFGDKKLNGPGKITKFLQLNKKLNNKKAEKASLLWFEDRGIKINQTQITKTARLGVAYAGAKWAFAKLRFMVK